MAQIRLIHIGDLHGHLVPRPNVRGDGTGRLEGGLARMATLIARLRAERPNALLVNTGDTIQGSAEALFTRGQALVDVVDALGPDVFAPGNWDYLYGKERFLELFGPGSGGPGRSSHRWGALACNVYHDGSDRLLLPPTAILDLDGARIGFVGLSSERAINALGPWVTEGIRFSGDAHEIPGHVADLRTAGVDIVVLVSEFGLAENILIAEDNPGIDVVLSSDMHEETHQIVRTTTEALVSEVGQDGTRLGVLDLTVGDGGITDWSHTLHVVDESIDPDPEVAALIEDVRRPFLSGADFRPHVNPINGSVLSRPIDEVVGHTEVALHRSDFVDGPRPAVISGTSHDLIAEAIRVEAAADIGHLRGFRYGTHVVPGPIRLEDLFHYLPVGAQVGVGDVPGAAIERLLENSADGALNPDPWAWKGGWLHATAGVRYRLDPDGSAGERTSEVTVRRAHGGAEEPLDVGATYRVAGFFYDAAAGKVGPLDAMGAVEVLRRVAWRWTSPRS
ncbi:5'-nucleotidase C-terminal domain-containing protein [Tessaracoccus sp. MC1679]|uniref:bifunctional metallophosphatase/5'-nucleotidase n=1 Tax=Tessaracoccus sp. MC1679 TaxID=2760313 RepID=UPI001603294D|nr:bifunctional metallophosphatase/5'-nucleotidase [Tessaracoccus sp. MC1679]MBB1517291.1 5'-nucleotidase C-terminal domain-containing protein [Tessaracoccus sp. MC1679]